MTADCIVSVGATDPDGDRWSDGSADPASKVKGSNYGAQTVDIGTHIMMSFNATYLSCAGDDILLVK